MLISEYLTIASIRGGPRKINPRARGREKRDQVEGEAMIEETVDTIVHRITRLSKRKKTFLKMKRQP